MEFTLAQWLFGWYQLFLMAYIASAVVPKAAIIVGNNEKGMSGKPALFFHILGKKKRTCFTSGYLNAACKKLTPTQNQLNCSLRIKTLPT